MPIGPAYPAQQPAALPTGTMLRRYSQVSNAANSTVTTANVVAVLPLNGDGTNNSSYNNDGGKATPDLVNNWWDVRGLSPSAGLDFRITVGNNAGGSVANANIGVRLIPSISSPGVFIDAPSVDITFRTQAQFFVTAYHGGVEAVQVTIRTTSAENIRHFGTYLDIDDVVA